MNWLPEVCTPQGYRFLIQHDRGLPYRIDVEPYFNDEQPYPEHSVVVRRLAARGDQWTTIAQVLYTDETGALRAFRALKECFGYYLDLVRQQANLNPFYRDPEPELFEKVAEYAETMEVL